LLPPLNLQHLLDLSPYLAMIERGKYQSCGNGKEPLDDYLKGYLRQRKSLY